MTLSVRTFVYHTLSQYSEWKTGVLTHCLSVPVIGSIVINGSILSRPGQKDRREVISIIISLLSFYKILIPRGRCILAIIRTEYFWQQLYATKGVKRYIAFSGQNGLRYKILQFLLGIRSDVIRCLSC